MMPTRQASSMKICIKCKGEMATKAHSLIAGPM